MSVLGNTPLLMTPEGYQISRSVRLRSSASAYFNLTPASAGSRTTWTYSTWRKRGQLGNYMWMLSAFVSAGTVDGIRFQSDNTIDWIYNGSRILATSQLFRDPSAWYHIVFVWDTTQATSSSRVRVYINGAQVTAFSTASYPAQNSQSAINNAVLHRMGGTAGTLNSEMFDGYQTEDVFIDGQALTPSSFGETDAVTGVWKPKKYSGTYGTNGFYLNFADNSASTAAAIGKDSSGNGNNWTPNNISVTAGVTYDSMLDVPTPYADGGNGRGNYAVWNPLGGSGIAVTDGNLKAANSAASYLGCFGSIALPSSGKFYFEAQLTANSGGSNIANFGIAPTSTALSGNQVGASNSASLYCGGTISINGSNSVRGSAGLTTDVFQVCYDAATGNVFLGINNTFYQSSGASGGDPANGTNPSRTLTAGDLAAWMFGYQIGWTINFGQRPFTYTPPTGFKALNTQNLPDSTIKKGSQYFDATTYTGTNANQTITNSGGMQPDLLWLKIRSTSGNHVLVDSVRGVNKTLYSSLTTAEETPTAGTAVTSLNTNGFSLGPDITGTTAGSTNGNTFTYVGWQWKKGATQGFDIVTYTGTGSARTVSHSLGVAPAMMIVKNRTTAGEWWHVYHQSLGATKAVFLNSTNAAGTSIDWWNNTAPTSSVFTVNTSGAVNGSGASLVAYLFAEVAGFSKFGSYTGNGSADGPFVYCGFRPRFVMLKRTDTIGGWQILDSGRSTYNLNNLNLSPNDSAAEGTTAYFQDFLSNGFKVRDNGAGQNASGGTYIFAAFAEVPFKAALGR